MKKFVVFTGITAFFLTLISGLMAALTLIWGGEHYWLRMWGSIALISIVILFILSRIDDVI